MGTLFTTLLNSTGALRVYGRAFNVIQNNITNANTPGYAKQDQVLVSMPFQPDRGRGGRSSGRADTQFALAIPRTGSPRAKPVAGILPATRNGSCRYRVAV